MCSLFNKLLGRFEIQFRGRSEAASIVQSVGLMLGGEAKQPVLYSYSI